MKMFRVHINAQHLFGDNEYGDILPRLSWITDLIYSNNDK